MRDFWIRNGFLVPDVPVRLQPHEVADTFEPDGIAPEAIDPDAWQEESERDHRSEQERF